MEVGCGLARLQHRDRVRAEMEVERAGEPLGQPVAGEVDMGDLAQRVDAGIGAARRRSTVTVSPVQASSACLDGAPGPWARRPGAASPGTGRRHIRAAGGSGASAQPSRVPTGSGKPRCSSSGVIGRLPARWTWVTRNAHPRRRRSSAAGRSPCRARRRRRRPRPASRPSRSPRGLAPAAGRRVERAQAALDHVGRLGEVEPALFARELAGVGDAVLGLRDGGAALPAAMPATTSGSISAASPASRSCSSAAVVDGPIGSGRIA